MELISRFGIQEGQLQWLGSVEAYVEKEGGTRRTLKRGARTTQHEVEIEVVTVKQSTCGKAGEVCWSG